jgi:hypothetical protein
MDSIDEIARCQSASDEPKAPVEFALYEESYCRLRVLIIAEHSDPQFERCTLRVLENVGSTDTPPPLRVGCEFEYLRRRGVNCSAMARLIRCSDAGDAS